MYNGIKETKTKLKGALVKCNNNLFEQNTSPPTTRRKGVKLKSPMQLATNL